MIKGFSSLLFAFFLITMAGCASRGHVKGAADPFDLQQICLKNQVEWEWDAVSQVVSLNHKGLETRILVGSNLAIQGNKRIILSAPIKRKRGQIIVPPDFEKKVIAPTVEQAIIENRDFGLSKFRKIVIDAGHGGKDPGAIGVTGLQEKSVVLDIALKLRDALERRGIKVILTRDDDHFLSLQERTEIASRAQADLFLSIHANSSHSPKVKGVEIYFLRPEDLDEEPQRQSNYKLMFEDLQMERRDPMLNKIVSDMLYSYKHGESSRLSRHLIDTTSAKMGTHNRGSRSSGFFVVKNTTVPAVLIEVGFLSNSSEERALGTSEYRQKIADSITEGLMEYKDDSGF